MTAIIACVDVGQGDCTVAVDRETGHALLIDCRAEHADSAVAELDRLGMTELATAVVTHTQQDHFGGVLDVLEKLADRFTGTLHFNQDSLMVTPVAGADRKIAGRKLRALVHRAREYGSRVHRAEDSKQPVTVGAISWELLAPSYPDVLDAITASDPNLASGIVLLRVGEDCVVIGGDAQLSVWQRVAGRIPPNAVIRWPHHGGFISPEAGAHAQLRDLLSPATVIVSVGATNHNKHPTAEFFDALGRRPGRLLCTQATPACVASGAAGGVCAGTITISANGTGEPQVTPTVVDHAAAIAAYGNGQCQSRP